MDKTKWYEESPNNASAMRVMCFIALFASIGFAFLAVTNQPIDVNVVYIVFGFLLAAFAPKALQKFAEQKIPDKSP